jgi:hypothetical protein
MLAENFKIVPIMRTTDFTTGLAGDSINMTNYHKATFIIMFGAVAGANLVVQIFSGATDALKNTALTFKYAYGSAAIASANCDVLETWADAATTGVVVADASHDNEMLICEVDAAAMLSGEEWLTIYPNGGTSGVAHIVAVLQPRYSGAASVSALA